MCACLVAQSCLTLCDLMDCSLPGSSVHGISQATILEWVAICFSRGSSQARDRTQVSWMAGRFFTIWATREAHGSPPKQGHPPRTPKTMIQPRIAIVGRTRNSDAKDENGKRISDTKCWEDGCRTDLAISTMNADNRSCRPGNPGSIPGSERSAGEGNSYPLQYSGLGIPMDRRTWGSIAHGVAKQWYTSEWLTLSLRVCECRPQRHWYTQKQLAHLFSPYCPIDNWWYRDSCIHFLINSISKIICYQNVHGYFVLCLLGILISKTRCKNKLET